MMNGDYYGMDEYDLRQRMNEEEEEEDENDSYVDDEKAIMYKQPKTGVFFEKIKDYYILIDSKDRDIFNESLFNFKINFSASFDSFDKNYVSVDKQIDDLLTEKRMLQKQIDEGSSSQFINQEIAMKNSLIQKEIKKLETRISELRSNPQLQQQPLQPNNQVLYVGNDKKCHTRERYYDINHISCEQVLMPSYDFLNKFIGPRGKTVEMNGQKIVYLIVRELQSNVDGSNNTIYCSFQMFRANDVDHFGVCHFKPLNDSPTLATPINLTSISIQLQYQDYMNDFVPSSPDLYEITAVCYNSEYSVFEVFMKNPVKLNLLKEGHLVCFYNVMFVETDLSFLNEFFANNKYYPVLELINTTDVQNVVSFRIPYLSKDITKITALKKYFTQPKLLDGTQKTKYAFNLSLQYQLLFKIQKIVPELNTDRFSSVKI